MTDVCEAYGIHPRRWSEYRRAAREGEDGGMVDFAVVDRFLIASGLCWWDVWDEEEFPEVAELLDAT